MERDYKSVADAVRDIFGAAVAIVERSPVSGGDINETSRLSLSNGAEIFAKCNRGVGADFFRAEAHGLAALREAGANVPEVLGLGASETGEAFLLLSYEHSGRRVSDFWEKLGHGLAHLHSARAETFVHGGACGFYEDNYIGRTVQCNTPHDNWAEFFRDDRLGAQMTLADRYFDAGDRRLCRNLLDHLAKFLPEPAFPSLLHGDLWSGNVMPDREGAPMFIDPAVYVGHHEADLAMTELFGGFSPVFYAAYHEIIPKEDGYADRRDIYNLYHLLNHLNLFGGSYLASVRRILKRYGE